MRITVRQAAANDLEKVKSMLQDGGLPILGVAEHFDSFLVAERDNGLVGAIGLESYGDTGLLRSAIVDKQLRGTGIGSILFEHLIAEARSRGIRKLVLLTNTAEGYFAARGFRVIDRGTLTGAVTRSVEFTEACPSHAVCMEMSL